MIVALLRARGHNVQFLGADVAVPFLVEEVVARRPAAVLLAATMADRLPTVKATAAALVEAASPRAMPIVAGGQIVPEHSAKLRQWGVVPASGGDLDEVLATILGFTARDDRALAGAGTRRRVA